ncbi:MAG: hypothetical protein IJ769_08110 [Clostridia bacterium]|nr:hypothetical protein [Clostridia bacterium]
MQRLNRGMLSRYDIPEHIPTAINAVQLGLDETLLGLVDRLLGPLGVGIAAIPLSAADRGQDPAALLREQDGMYTVFVRGYQGEQPVNREEVVQSILRVASPDEAEALAAEPALEFCLVDTDGDDLDAALALAARLLEARRSAGLSGLIFLCLGEGDAVDEVVRRGIAERAPDLSGWLASQCGFLPALADGIALRAEAKEAARLCAEMNYADGMIHLVEPGATLTIEVPRGERPIAAGEGIAIVDDLAPVLARKRRLFDAGLFAMAAPGWLLGLNTLSDCMKHEALRAFVGQTYMRELLPADAAERAVDAPCVIRAFERFENPLNDNAILRAAHHLLRVFRRATLPLIRDWADANFEPPRRLTFALAATIMLYAGARPNADGQYEVQRGGETHRLTDDPDALAVFATLSHDMPPEALAYAALADRELWGSDLREIDGLEARVALDIANLQRNPRYLPEADDA